MNTNEFTQRAMADPWSRDPEFLKALVDDPRHRGILDAVRAFDRDLKTAMRVEVPEGLAERIKVKHLGEAAQVASHGASMNTSGRRRNPVWRLAMAAGLVLGMGLAGLLGLQLYKAEHQQELLQTAVLRHSYHEPDSWTNREALSDQRVNAAFLGFGGRMVRELKQVTHAARCRLDSHLSAHLVVWENGHPVTVYYLHKSPVERMLTMQDQRFAGFIVPGDERGSWAAVAQLGTSMEDARNALDRARSSVQWRL